MGQHGRPVVTIGHFGNQALQGPWPVPRSDHRCGSGEARTARLIPPHNRGYELGCDPQPKHRHRVTTPLPRADVPVHRCVQEYAGPLHAVAVTGPEITFADEVSFPPVSDLDKQSCGLLLPDNGKTGYEISCDKRSHFTGNYHASLRAIRRSSH